MAVDLTQFHAVFFEEAAEHLADMERRLVALDPGDPAREDVDGIFRAAHSIKGGANMFGFAEIAQVTHELETLLDAARRGSPAAPSLVFVGGGRTGCNGRSRCDGRRRDDGPRRR